MYSTLISNYISKIDHSTVSVHYQYLRVFFAGTFGNVDFKIRIAFIFTKLLNFFEYIAYLILLIYHPQFRWNIHRNIFLLFFSKQQLIKSDF